LVGVAVTLPVVFQLGCFKATIVLWRMYELALVATSRVVRLVVVFTIAPPFVLLVKSPIHVFVPFKDLVFSVLSLSMRKTGIVDVVVEVGQKALKSLFPIFLVGVIIIDPAEGLVFPM
jgi:hypothetical protein